MRPFSQLHYQRPNFTELTRQLKRLARRFKRERDLELRQEILREFQDLYEDYQEMYLLALLRHQLNKSEFYANELSVFQSVEDELKVIVDDFYTEFLRAKVNFSPQDPSQATLNRLALDRLQLYGPNFREAKEIESAFLLRERRRLEKIKRRVSGTDSVIHFQQSLRHPQPEERLAAWHELSHELMAHEVDSATDYLHLLLLRQHLQNAGGYASAYQYAYHYSHLYFEQQSDWIAFKEGLERHFMPLFQSFFQSRIRRLGEATVKVENAFCLISDEGLSHLPSAGPDFLTLLSQDYDLRLGGENAFFTTLLQEGYMQELGSSIDLQAEMPIFLPKSRQVVLLYPAYTGAQIDLCLHELSAEFARQLLRYATVQNFPARQAWPEAALAEALCEFGLLAIFSRRQHRFESEVNGDEALLGVITRDELIDLLLARALMLLPQQLFMADFELQVNAYEVKTRKDIAELWRRLAHRAYPDLDRSEVLAFQKGYERQLNFELFAAPFVSLEFILALCLILYEQPWQKGNDQKLLSKFMRFVMSNRSLPLPKRIENAGFTGLSDPDFLARAAFSLANRLEI